MRGGPVGSPCSRNPHDETVVAWEKVVLQPDRGWAGEKVVRSWEPNQAAPYREASELGRIIYLNART
jgi:hypothetical protein